MPERVARVHAFASARAPRGAADQAAQRGGAPQPVVVAAARVEAHDERGLADARREVVDVRTAGRSCRDSSQASISTRSARAAALFRERLMAVSEREHRVAVVGAAAAVELVALAARASTARGPSRPAGHLRLLVEVAVQQHGVVAVAVPGSRCRSRGVRSFQPHAPRASRRRSAARVAQRPSASPRRPCGRARATAGRTSATCSGCGCIRPAAARCRRPRRRR